MKRKLLFVLSGTMMALVAYTQTNLVENPGFEDPDDGVKYQQLNNYQITAWTSDDTTTNHEGREPATNMHGKYRAYMNGNAGELYQDIATIPAAGALYTYSLEEKMNWSGAGTSTDTIYHILSFDAYPTGGDPVADRVQIDTFPNVLPNPDGVYGVDTVLVAKLNIPANSKWAGQRLIIGYYVRNYVDIREKCYAPYKNGGIDAKDVMGKNDWDNIDSVTVIQSAPVVSVASVNTNSISIYPNPTTGIVNLKTSENANIEVYNTLGELVKTIKLEKSFLQIDLSNLSKGLYIINVNTGKAVETQKLILR